MRPAELLQAQEPKCPLEPNSCSESPSPDKTINKLCRALETCELVDKSLQEIIIIPHLITDILHPCSINPSAFLEIHQDQMVLGASWYQLEPFPHQRISHRTSVLQNLHNRWSKMKDDCSKEYLLLVLFKPGLFCLFKCYSYTTDGMIVGATLNRR